MAKGIGALKRTRPPIERMAYIGKLIRAGKTFTKRQVMNQFEIGAKAVERDIEFMRDRLAYEIEWHRSKRHYFGKPPPNWVL